jgi:Big-like domain-containing protein
VSAVARAGRRGLRLAPGFLLAIGACSKTTAATPYSGVCAPMVVQSWNPAAAATGVPTDVVVSATLSDYPDPDTLSATSALVTTGVYRVPETYRVDLLDKAILLRPIADLEGQLGYSVSVFPDLRSLSGCQTTEAQLAFSTGAGPSGATPAAPPSEAAVQAIFDARCGANCHETADGGCLAEPLGALSLCAQEARAALIDVASHEVAALSRVAPGSAAASYLLRKVIPAPPNGGPMPTVAGEREPPGEPLADDEIRTLEAWIDDGAPP